MTSLQKTSPPPMNFFRYDDKADAVVGGTPHFWISKRVFDVLVSIMLLPLFAISAAVLLVLNPRLNPGPLFFVQIRMGRDCRAFRVYKFRSMLCATSVKRDADDPIEHDRITPFGKQLRKSRIDELPQIMNVLRGEMSLIGPRPDSFHHARHFVRNIPQYRIRHRIKPGISGLAQVTLGYAEGIEATRQKANADIFYMQNAGFRLDAFLVLKTIKAVVLRKGA